MTYINQDVLFFFDKHQTAFSLYEVFADKIESRFPDTKMKVQKSQIF